MNAVHSNGNGYVLQDPEDWGEPLAGRLKRNLKPCQETYDNRLHGYGEEFTKAKKPKKKAKPNPGFYASERKHKEEWKANEQARGPDLEMGLLRSVFHSGKLPANAAEISTGETTGKGRNREKLPCHFDDPCHVMLWCALKHLVATGQRPTRAAVMLFAGQHGLKEYSEKDTEEILDDIAATGLPEEPGEWYVEQLVRKEVCRGAAEQLAVIADIASDGHAADALESLREVCTRLEGVSGAGVQNGFPMQSDVDLLAEDIKEDWLVEEVVHAGQCMALGGASKTLKTSLALELCTSIGAGLPFLGKFPTQKAPTAIFSGESGKLAIKDALKRIRACHGIPADQPCTQLHYAVPKIGNAEQLARLRATIIQGGIRFCALDPWYLMHTQDTAKHAANLNMDGTILEPLGQIGQETGCVICILHHAALSRARTPAGEEPATIQQLSHPGLQAWLRQAIMLERREQYKQDGNHRFWLRTGGSMGHGALWAIDIREGKRPNRVWHIDKLVLDSELKQEKAEEAQHTKEAEEHDKYLKQCQDVKLHFASAKPGQKFSFKSLLKVIHQGPKHGKATLDKMVNLGLLEATSGEYKGTLATYYRLASPSAAEVEDDL